MNKKIAFPFLTLSLLLITHVSAEEQPNNNNLLDIIIVSATKTEVPYKEIPKTINVLDEDALKQIDASSVAEALEWIPGVSTTNDEPFYASPSVRGLGNGSTIMTIDGLKVSYNTNKGSRTSPINIDPFLIKQIEVEKGSSSVLYGSGGMGGMIALRTKTVDDLLEENNKLGGFARFKYGDLNRRMQTTFGVYGTNEQKTFDWMITGSTYKTKTEEDVGTYKSKSNTVNAKLGFNIDDNQRIALSLTNGKRKTEGYGLSPDKVHNYSAQLNYDISRGNNVNLKVALGHHKANRKAVATSPYAPYENQETSVAHTQFDIHNTHFFDGDMLSHELTYGLNTNFFNQSGKADGIDNTFLAPKGSRREIGLFVQDRMKWSKLTLIGALRYNDYKMTSHENPTIHENSLLPSIGATLDATSWLSLHANYSHDYRAPSVDELYTTDTRTNPWNGMTIVIYSNPDLKSETSKNKEIGLTIHGDGLITENDSAFVRLSLFDQDIKNMIDNDGGFNPLTNMFEYTSINRSSVNRKGVELEAQYKSDKFTFALGTDYMRTKDNGSNDVFHAAKTLKMRTSYHFANPDIDVSWLTHAAKGRDVTDPWSGTTHRKGYMIHNMRVDWNKAFGIKPLTINAEINNVFDKEYETYHGFDGAERNFTVGIMAKF